MGCGGRLRRYGPPQARLMSLYSAAPLATQVFAWGRETVWQWNIPLTLPSRVSHPPSSCPPKLCNDIVPQGSHGSFPCVGGNCVAVMRLGRMERFASGERLFRGPRYSDHPGMH
ncbi:hypothetical protein BC938DRAFT_481613, partial [Jimgerdemannia flammicorona]